MKKKNRYLGYHHLCRVLIDYLCVHDVANKDSYFLDSDGDGFSADMGYLLEGLRAFEEYFKIKIKKE